MKKNRLVIFLTALFMFSLVSCEVLMNILGELIQNEEENDEGTETGNSTTINDGFIKIKGVKISGNETWIPSSETFIKNRAFTIPGFYISDHEVTRGEWKDVMGTYPGVKSDKLDFPEYEKLHGEGDPVDFYDKNGKKLSVSAADKNPAGNISWYDAMYYCNYLSIKKGLTPCYTMYINVGEGLEHSKDPAVWVEKVQDWSWKGSSMYFVCDFKANGYRLPTAAEWEWAARGKEQFDYPGSNNLEEVAWVNSNTQGTRDVKSKKPNGFGLYDMAGNIVEYLWDGAWSSSYSVPTRTEIDTPYTGYAGETSEKYDYHSIIGLDYSSTSTDIYGFDSKLDIVGYYNCGIRLVRTDTKSKEYEPVDPDALAITWVIGHGKLPYTHPGNNYDHKTVVRKGYVLTEEDLPELSEKGWTFLGWSKEVGDVITSDTTITALWREGDPDYGITYSYEGEEGAPSVTLPSSKQLKLNYRLKEEDLPKYTASGYTFYWNRGVGERLKAPTKIELYCVKDGELIGTKEKPDAVGDIVFADGSAVPYSDSLTLTKKQNALAIAVIFDVSSNHIWGMSVETSGEKLEADSNYLPNRANAIRDVTLANKHVYDVFKEYDTYTDVHGVQAWSYVWVFRAGRETYNSNWLVPSPAQFDTMRNNYDLLTSIYAKISEKAAPVDFDETMYLTSFYRKNNGGSSAKIICSDRDFYEIWDYGKKCTVLPVKDFAQVETNKPDNIRILYYKGLPSNVPMEENFMDKIVPYGYTLTEEDLPHLDYINLYHCKFTGWLYTPFAEDEPVYIKPGTRLYEDICIEAEYGSCVYEYYGTKAPSEPKEVGDIVFTDGSSTPAITLLTADDERKPVYKDAEGRKYGINPDLYWIYFYNGDERRNSITGIVFYAGNGKLGNRTLMVGGNYKGCEFCSSVLYGKEITTIPVDDIDGSDNFECLKKFIKSAGLEDDTEDVNAFAHYAPFYFARNYGVNSEVLKGTRYQDNWYVPTIEEWKEIYKIRYITSNLSLWDTGVVFNTFDGMTFLTSIPYGKNDCYVASNISARTPSASNFDSEFDAEMVIGKEWRLTPVTVAVIRKAD